MIIVFAIVLFLLGLLGAEPLITLKAPAFKTFLVKLEKYQEALGLAGIVLAIIEFVNWLDSMGQLRYAPVHYFIRIFSITDMMALGLVFGLEIIRRNLKDTNSSLFVTMEKWRIFSLRFQKPFGVAGVVLGLMTLFAHI